MGRYFAALLATIAVVSAATGTLSTYMPACAIDCLTKAIGDATTCKGADDLECFCIADNYRAIYDSGVACVLQACGSDVAVGEVLPAAARMCEEVAASNGQTVTSVDFPTTTAPSDLAPATTTSLDVASTSTSTSINADARITACVLGVVVPLVLAAAANV